MNPRRPLTLALLAALAVAVGHAQPPQTGWMLEPRHLNIGTTGRPALLFFHTPGDAACLRMQNWVLVNPTLQSALGAVDAAQLDFRRSGELAEALGVTDVPTTVLVSPNGDVLESHAGHIDPEDIVGWIESHTENRHTASLPESGSDGSPPRTGLDSDGLFAEPPAHWSTGVEPFGDLADSQPTAETSSLRHSPRQWADAGVPLQIEAYTPEGASSVVIHMVVREQPVPVEIPMTATTPSLHIGLIPAELMRGSQISYYLVADRDGSPPVASPANAPSATHRVRLH